MHLPAKILAVAIALALTACGALAPEQQSTPSGIAPILTSEEAFDDQTFARPTEARVTHVSLDLAMDFNAKSIGGTATLDLLAADHASEIVLDSNGLRVSSVSDEAGNALEFALGETVEGKGEPLTIQLPQQRLERGCGTG